MEKELLTIEFRYHVVPKSEYSSENDEKTITIGIYDTFKEAIEEGNKVLKQLSSRFKYFRSEFGTNNGPFGSSTRLVCDYLSGYPKVFCKITKLNFEDVEDGMNEVFDREAEYRKWLSQ